MSHGQLEMTTVQYTKPLSFAQRRALRGASTRSILDTPVLPPGPSRVEQLIEDLRAPCPSTRPVISPLFDSELYIFMANLSGPAADEVRAKNPPLEPVKTELRWWIDKPRNVNKYNVPSDPDWIKVDLRVTPKGRVKVSMCVPMAPVQEYHRQGHKAPIETRIVAAKKFGYPDEVLEKMLARHDAWDPEKEAAFIEEVFGVMKKSTTKAVKTHEVARPKKTSSSKRRYADFYDLTGLLDYYDEMHTIQKDDLKEYYTAILMHIKANSYQEGDILFIGSVHDEQERDGFATVIKGKKFKVGDPEELFNNKKMYYSQAIEAMNTLWNGTFGYDVVSEEVINRLTVDDMYDD